MKYRVFLDGGWYDEAKYPIPPAPVEPSAAECRRTAAPDLYHEWQEWCEVAGKTHRQVPLPGLLALQNLDAQGRGGRLRGARAGGGEGA